MSTYCTPVVVDGWGGAGDGCLAVGDAAAVLAAIEVSLRGALPEHWSSAAADEYRARVSDLLLHARLLGELLDTAHRSSAALAAAVAAARSEP